MRIKARPKNEAVLTRLTYCLLVKIDKQMCTFDTPIPFKFQATLWKMVDQIFSDDWCMTCTFPVCLFSGCYDIIPDVIILERASVFQTV